MQVKSSISTGNSELLVISGGCTSVLQPLDISLNKPFKDLTHHKWLDFMEKSLTDQEKKRQEEKAELSDNPLAS